ncbi:hypothetical protein SAMN02745166_04994 [Prosthecobacter debontii]|uniref:Uncharacterized protein n=1 Tax=Prosthecobacter debontii TaxID=48467 RepID=A0A1T4Z489_9BACT|nr:hypothetical protein [Prosthecobacter debontii]SKB08688.1 hypothetical protein SAMN02745166_04994 [Prosthecobacter debontii]
MFIVTPRVFFARLTEPEKVALFTACLSDATILRWVVEFAMSERIRSDNADLVTGLQALVTAGLLTAERQTELLA